MDMKFEVTVIPVADVDRSKAFYQRAGFRLDADFPISSDYRVVQLTPPGSAASIQFGTGLTAAQPGSAQGLYLVVTDVVAAHDELVQLGIDVTDVYHKSAEGTVAGPQPVRASYASFSSFSDPDGNGWLIQEVTDRAPGR